MSSETEVMENDDTILIYLGQLVVTDLSLFVRDRESLTHILLAYWDGITVDQVQELDLEISGSLATKKVLTKLEASQTMSDMKITFKLIRTMLS